jgi:polysaccharide deacetylase 2 family uncharacterized protein YibQ
MRRGSDRETGGVGRWLSLAAVVVLGGVAAGLYFAGDRLSDRIQSLLASSSGGDLAQVPQPRGSGSQTPAPGDLTEMPAMVTTNGATPELPDLSPADLLAQGALLGDRALRETAFDQPPARRFARPFGAPEGRPLLAVLLTGLGLDRAATAAAIAGLPAEVSLSFSPEAKDLAAWIEAARAFGHEALVDLPLQSKDKRDLGARGILIGFNPDETARRLDAIANAAPGVFGFAGDGGDALLLDDGATAVLTAEIARLGLAFIDTSGEPMSHTLPAAKENSLAAARSTVTLDEKPSRTAVTERLAAAAEVAQEQGRALAVAKVSPLTITLLAEWLRRQGEQGPILAPASALLPR